MTAHGIGGAGGRGDALGRVVSSQPRWPTDPKTSKDGPKKRTNLQHLLFAVSSSQLSISGPSVAGWGAGWQGSLLLAVL